jgi:hypothetical protein
MATLAEEMEKWKKRHPELANKGMISVADPNAPRPRLGNVRRTSMEQSQIETARFKGELELGGGKEAFLDKIGARYTEGADTGDDIQRQLLFSDLLKKAGKAKYIKGIQAYGGLAKIVGEDIASRRRAGLDLATSLMTAESTRERTGVMEAGDIATGKHRAALEGFRAEDIGISRAGLESLDIHRRATAATGAGMLKVAQEGRPGSLQSQLVGLEKQMQKDVSDVIQEEGAPEGILEKSERKWWWPDAPNTAMEKIEAIRKSYEGPIADLRAKMKGKKTGGPTGKGAKAPSFDEQEARFRAKGQDMPFTRDEYKVWLETKEGKEKYPGGR